MERTALDLPLGSQTLAKPREGLFANHWALYIGVVLLVALASYAYWLKTRSIFACQAQGYSADRYLAYCGGGNYADFEHGALYYNLEPPALDNARNADVLVLGNSRLQVALSNEATADWFKNASARYYLLAFSYNENMNFTEELLRRMNPRASVFIINVDDFFDRRETAAAKTILHDPEAQSRYEWKHFSQAAAPIGFADLSPRFAGRGLLSSVRAKLGLITGFLMRSLSTRRMRSATTGRSIRQRSATAPPAQSIFSRNSPRVDV